MRTLAKTPSRRHAQLGCSQVHLNSLLWLWQNFPPKGYKRADPCHGHGLIRRYHHHDLITQFDQQLERIQYNVPTDRMRRKPLFKSFAIAIITVGLWSFQVVITLSGPGLRC
jgi:hypothetical protein